MSHFKTHCKALAKYAFKAFRDIFTNLFATPLKPKNHKTILILRIDAIGDFVLFSPFIKQIRQYFKHYHITLMANSINENLALGLHKKYIDDFIFISPKKFQRNLIYRIRFLNKLKKKEFFLCLNPIYSRDIVCNELISRINASILLTPSGDKNNMPSDIKSNDSYYTRLTPCKDEILFEYYRNGEFISYVFKTLKNLCDLQGDYKMPKARIDVRTLPPLEQILDKNTLDSIKNHYCILFIGASAKYRQYSIENFAKIALHLLTQHKQNIIICGGKEDKINANKLLHLIKANAINLYDKSIINFCGETTLMQLATLVYNGNLVVSNETSAAHFAVFLDTAIIAVYNGNHLGRFIPYPQGISDKYYPVFHPFITANPDKYKDLSNSFSYKSELDINEIKANEVIKTIDTILRSNNAK